MRGSVFPFPSITDATANRATAWRGNKEIVEVARTAVRLRSLRQIVAVLGTLCGACGVYHGLRPTYQDCSKNIQILRGEGLPSSDYRVVGEIQGADDGELVSLACRKDAHAIVNVRRGEYFYLSRGFRGQMGAIFYADAVQYPDGPPWVNQSKRTEPLPNRSKTASRNAAASVTANTPRPPRRPASAFDGDGYQNAPDWVRRKSGIFDGPTGRLLVGIGQMDALSSREKTEAEAEASARVELRTVAEHYLATALAEADRGLSADEREKLFERVKDLSNAAGDKEKWCAPDGTCFAVVRFGVDVVAAVAQNEAATVEAKATSAVVQNNGAGYSTVAPTGVSTRRIESLAITQVRGPELRKQLTTALAEIATDRAARIAGLKVIAPSEINEMIGWERQRDLLACTDQAICMAEIGGALGVDALLVITVGKAGKLFIVSFKVIDVKNSDVLLRSTAKADSEESLVAAVESGVNEIVGKLRR